MELLSLVAAAAPAPPIIFMIADDLGFNDVSFHGSPQIPTPALDELATTGLQLDNYHAQPVCSPTRATIMAGRHAIHHGIYMPFSQGTALRLNLSYTLLPQYLKKAGYSTHMVGKWHLGQNVLAALPTGRGFDSYYGYWSGAEDYYLHDTKGAYDFADDTSTCRAANGSYSTYLFAARAVEVIEAQAKAAAPFFLYLAWQNVHWPLEAPTEYVARFANSTGGNHERQSVAAMAAILDDGVRNVTDALKRTGLWESTLLVFVSDNGGPTNGNEGTSSNNYPMRGGKNTLWEGGTRVIGVVRGPWVGAALRGTTTFAPFHAVDWLPTLVHAATGDPDWHRLAPPGEPPYLDGDGMSVLKTIHTGAAVRTELLLECHPGHAPVEHGNALIVDGWKLLQLGTVHPQEEFGWHPPPGQDAAATGYTLGCDTSKQPTNVSASECADTPCLFHVTDDPCEYVDLAASHADKVAELSARLAQLQATAVPPVEPHGCTPVVTDGAWRPCDAPDDAPGFLVQ